MIVFQLVLVLKLIALYCTVVGEACEFKALPRVPLHFRVGLFGTECVPLGGEGTNMFVAKVPGYFCTYLYDIH